VKAPPGIGEWTQKRFRHWVGGRIETHTDQLTRLEKVVAAQNVMVLDLRPGPPGHLCPIPPDGLLRWLTINFGTCVSGSKSTTAIVNYRDPLKVGV